MPVTEDKYETLFVRVLPEVKQALQEQVDGLNATRPLGSPVMTMTTFVLACVNQAMGWQHDGPVVAPKRASRRKSQAKRAAKRSDVELKLSSGRVVKLGAAND